MATTQLYDTTFMKSLAAGSRASAAVVVPIVIDAVGEPVLSVIDVGCGPGEWLAEWAERGARCIGVDGPSARAEVDDRVVFIETDLANPLGIDERFDVAMSLEVAEHLPPDRGPGFVDDLCRLSDVVLFGAARPHQKGTGHINCAPLGYWIDQFARNGFEPDDCIRPAVWGDERVRWWYQQNTMLFRRAGERSLRLPVEVAHPELVVSLVRPPAPTIRRVVQQVVPAFRADLSRVVRAMRERAPRR